VATNRLAFAGGVFEHRTANEVCREEGPKAGSWGGAGRFLRSGSTAKSSHFLRLFKKCREVSLRARLCGGEGGIRPLDTGVSPYNGLAKATRPTPIARKQAVTVTSSILSRAESGCSAGASAPECAPLTTRLPGTEKVATRLVRRSVSELRPHPSYARPNLSVQPFKLAASEWEGESGFSHPILITQDNCVIDGYARLELAKKKGRPTLNCIDYGVTSEEALEELIRKHRRSQGRRPKSIFVFPIRGQMHPDRPDDPDSMLVGYDDGLLSSDGETLIQREMNCVRGTGALRFAVYLHIYDPLRPLQWQHGQVTQPPVQDAPAKNGASL
jgi:hypothetical protein